jgi:type I restriction enzyme M protein
VIFFTKGYKTEAMWLYDGRINVPHITKKGRPLIAEHLAEFEKCYGNDPNGRVKRKQSDSKDDRWRSFQIEELKKRDYKIDSLKWLKDESQDNGDELLEPDELATEAIAELEIAVSELREIVELMELGERPQK